MWFDRTGFGTIVTLEFPTLPSVVQIAGCKILVVGDVMLDRYWYGDVARISPEAPVPVVLVRGKDNRLGGAANVALNIKTLGARVTLLSAIGIDEAAIELRGLLKKHDIEAELTEHSDMETIVKLRVIGHSQQMLRVDFESEPDHEVLAGMLASFTGLLDHHDVVLFSDYGKGGLAHIPEMIDIARKSSKLIFVDPKGSDYARYKGASLITPNRAELAHVIGLWSSEEQLHTKAQNLRKELEIPYLLLTRSEEGMTLFENDSIRSVPAITREVADVTGAGDTVIATLAVMAACGLSVEQAMIWANYAGGLVVSKLGTATVTYGELRD
jgi:rfaE bifunctional protein kinase chain/domain